ncbi:MAG: peptidase C39 family protein [Thermoactinomyces sp.]
MLRVFSLLLILMLSFLSIPSVTLAKEQAKSSKQFIPFKPPFGGVFDGVAYNGKSIVLNPLRLRSGQDSSGKYDSGAYYYGTWTSPPVPARFLEAIASWQANTPQNTWIEVELRSFRKKEWSKWYSMGVWHEHDLPFKRHSVRGQGDQNGTVSVDTLVLKKPANIIQARVTLFTKNPQSTPFFHFLGVSLANGTDKPGQIPATGLTGELNVPMRSQMIYPDGGEIWCSPTSTSMVMAYWAKLKNKPEWDQPVPHVVNKVWDYVYNGGGNWAFNTAYAAAMGLEARVTRFSSLAEAEKWIAAGVPLIASIAYDKGELPGTPIPRSGGHLLVIRGFDKNGNVITNDPAGPSNEKVRIIYPRQAFEKVFLNHSNGTVYLIYPKGWPIPKENYISLLPN